VNSLPTISLNKNDISVKKGKAVKPFGSFSTMQPADSRDPGFVTKRVEFMTKEIDHLRAKYSDMKINTKDFNLIESPGSLERLKGNINSIKEIEEKDEHDKAENNDIVHKAPKNPRLSSYMIQK